MPVVACLRRFGNSYLIVIPAQLLWNSKIRSSSVHSSWIYDNAVQLVIKFIITSLVSVLISFYIFTNRSQSSFPLALEFPSRGFFAILWVYIIQHTARRKSTFHLSWVALSNGLRSERRGGKVVSSTSQYLIHRIPYISRLKIFMTS